MIFSVLQLVLVIRAFMRSAAEKFPVGIALGLARVALMLWAAAISFRQASIVIMSGLTLRLPASGGTLSAPFVALAGPLVSFAVLAVSWKRYRNAPAANEEKLRRPFEAWLPVAILDAMYVVVMIGAVWFSEPS